MPTTLDRVIHRLTPQFLYDLNLRRRRHWVDRELGKAKNARDVFSAIYEHGVWGSDKAEPGRRFYSGSGSHRSEWVDPYVVAVQDLCASLEKVLGRKPDAVDLGCGDFSVGARLRGACGRYIACDIVDGMIADHAARYAGLDVDFRVLDMIEDALPDGDIVFVRQVLQHLSNQDIARVAPKLARYKYVVVTEEIPAGDNWPPNLDKRRDQHIRVGQGSGVVLTAPPFSLKPESLSTLCAIPSDAGVLKTELLIFAS